MTDYLEQAAQGEADILWEASRERGVPAPAREERTLLAAESLEWEEKNFPVLEDLQRAQRQGETLAALPVRRARQESEAVLPERRLRRIPGEAALPGWEERGTPFRSGSAGGAEHLWVRQVDRAFQRDSRRYDGPFSLY